MELGHWVTGSLGHLGRLSRPGHRVVILTRCDTRVFPVFEREAELAVDGWQPNEDAVATQSRTLVTSIGLYHQILFSLNFAPTDY